MQKISGIQISEKIIAELAKLPKPKKEFAAILVGSDPMSLSFLKKKQELAQKLGIACTLHQLPLGLSEEALAEAVKAIATREEVGGVVLQLPVPGCANPQNILNAIPKEKDVDVLGDRALGAFYAGTSPILPPAVATCKTVFEVAGFDVMGKTIAVIGAGALVGKPVVTWLTKKAATIITLRRGGNFDLLKNADAIISGTGAARLIKPEMLKENALVVDFGYASELCDGKHNLIGDFDADETKIANLGGFYTPTPRGTGPILVAELMRNFYTLNR